MSVCGRRGVCLLVCVRGCAVAQCFVVVSPSSCCRCAPLWSSAAWCSVVRAVVPWPVAVLPARCVSLALVPCSTVAVYCGVLFRSLRARSSSLPLPCGLLFAFGGRPRVGAAYSFLYPCLLGPSLLPCAHFALSRPFVALPFLVPPLFLGPAEQHMGVQGMGLAVGREVWHATWVARQRYICLCLCGCVRASPFVHTTSTVLATYKVCV